MKRTIVSSSNVRSVGYDEETKTLEVEFYNGAVYHYHTVPKSDFTGLVGAESAGRYLHRHIASVYSHSRISKP